MGVNTSGVAVGPAVTVGSLESVVVQALMWASEEGCCVEPSLFVKSGTGQLIQDRNVAEIIPGTHRDA